MREAAKTRIRKAIEVFFRRSDSILIVESVFACLLLFIIIFFFKKRGFYSTNLALAPPLAESLRGGSLLQMEIDSWL